jgi:acetyl-CoA carboxylase biotin carboxyl carrier protein
MHEEEIRRLIQILEESDEIVEIETASYPLGGKRIRVSKRGAATASLPAAAPAPEATPEPETAPDAGVGAGLHTFKAPMVGTFYHAPSPGAPQFVSIGDRVTPGTVLCIIEAMKLMNEIESDGIGVIHEILAENGQPVEFGQPLFLISQE